jgi:aryl-alcohol dehydrogenase-like predicted oxidoreductase
MRYRQLGKAGYAVSEIGHGLWGMGSWSGSDDKASAAALEFAVELGCTFFDSAHAYGNGRSDRLLGDLLERHRGRGLRAASKIPPKNMKWPADAADSLSAAFPMEHVLRGAEQIRKNLRVDCIDLLQFHVWSDAWARDEDWMRTVRKLKEEGVIAAFGLSLNRWEPSNGIAAIRSGLVDVVQVIYNIFDQAPEDELFVICRRLNIGVIARVPLDEGSLGGKLTRTTKFPENDWRSRYFCKENLQLTMDRVEALLPLVPTGMTLPEFALRFILANPVVSTTIVGMRRPEHVRANIASSDGRPLDDSLLGALRKHRWDRTPAEWSR